jgi:hypothetical protein
MRILAALALTAAGLASFATAAPASAIVPCQTGDVGCYQTCYLPHYDKQHGVYWVYC